MNKLSIFQKKMAQEAKLALGLIAKAKQVVSLSMQITACGNLQGTSGYVYR
jgi:hypothetical protein